MGCHPSLMVLALKSLRSELLAFERVTDHQQPEFGLVDTLGANVVQVLLMASG